MQRVVHLKGPQGPVQWLVAIVVLVAAGALAFLLFGVFLALVALTILTAPIVRWWRRRRRPAAPMGGAGAGEVELPDDAEIVDVDFEIVDAPPRE